MIRRQKVQKKQFKRKGVRDIPLTSAAALERSRTEINETNRRRARQMEQRVAKYLRGARTPMSGAAASFKGDVTVDFINNPGKYIIECKLSAAVSPDTEQPKINISLSWFAKIQQEAIAMRARFGILVIHFHKRKDDYVFLRADHLNWIFTAGTMYPSVIDKIIAATAMATIPVINITHLKNGKVRSIIAVEEQSIVNKWMVDIDGFKVAAVETPDGIYYILYLSQFRDLLEGV